MLVLRVEYLLGRSMATHPSDRHRGEWPPHPERLFFALAAALFETDSEADERRALEWFETLPAPEILATPAFDREVATAYVPVNDTAPGKLELLPESRSKAGRTFPVKVPAEPVVWFRWPDTNVPTDLRSPFGRLCRKVTCLGHSASLVRVSLHEELAPDAADGGFELYRPVEVGSHSLRTPGDGRLAQVEQLFAATVEIASFDALEESIKQAKGKAKKVLKSEFEVRFPNGRPLWRRPTPQLWSRYEVGPATPTEPNPAPAGSHFSSELLVFPITGIEGRQALGQRWTRQLCDIFRKTVLSCTPDPIPEWLGGHRPGGEPGDAEEGHAAFLALPDVGHPHAAGRLLGVALALPRGIDPRELARQLSPLLFQDSESDGRLPARHTLHLTREISVTVEFASEPDPRRGLWPRTWVCPKGCDLWSTVTPIALDRHPKRRATPTEYWGEVERIIADGCERIGLPRPEVTATRVADFIGAWPATDMPRLQTGSQERRHTHARLHFPEPVVGPVLIGAGRYRGHGLCRPILR